MLSQFSGAILDHSRRYRFLLWRFWDDRPRMLFIGLNPSTANELQDDPTVRRLCAFAQSWGYGGLYACNVFSQITPYPKELCLETAIHPADTHVIKMVVELTSLIVCGWGDGIEKAPHGIARANTIKGFLKAPMCFGLATRGNPKHPLYMKKDTELEEYNGQ
jgi:hypothetical protein